MRALERSPAKLGKVEVSTSNFEELKKKPEFLHFRNFILIITSGDLCDLDYSSLNLSKTRISVGQINFELTKITDKI